MGERAMRSIGYTAITDAARTCASIVTVPGEHLGFPQWPQNAHCSETVGMMGNWANSDNRRSYSKLLYTGESVVSVVFYEIGCWAACSAELNLSRQQKAIEILPR